MGFICPTQIFQNMVGLLFKWEHDKLYTLRCCDNMSSVFPYPGNTHVDTTNLCGACRERSAAKPRIALVRRDVKRREWHDLRDFAGEVVV